MKSREYAKVIGQEKIAPDIYSLRIEAPQIAAEAKAGPFLSLYSADKSRMLPRPTSICEIDPSGIPGGGSRYGGIFRTV